MGRERDVENQEADTYNEVLDDFYKLKSASTETEERISWASHQQVHVSFKNNFEGASYASYEALIVDTCKEISFAILGVTSQLVVLPC